MRTFVAAAAAGLAAGADLMEIHGDYATNRPADFLSGVLITFINSPNAFFDTRNCLDSAQAPGITSDINTLINKYDAGAMEDFYTESRRVLFDYYLAIKDTCNFTDDRNLVLAWNKAINWRNSFFYYYGGTDGERDAIDANYIKYKTWIDGYGAQMVNAWNTTIPW